MDIIVAVAVAIALNLSVLALLSRRYDRKLYRIVGTTWTVSVALRSIVAIFVWLYHEDAAFAQTFWGDSATYDGFGALLADSWSHGGAADIWRETVEGKINAGFIYFVAILYYVFGHNPLLVQFVNSAIGTGVAIVILEIGLLLYNKPVAVRAMMFTAFFPQLMFWSTAIYKDPAVMLCISANILFVLHLKRRFNYLPLLGYLVTAIALIWLRFYIFWVVLLATLSGFIIDRKRGFVASLAIQGTIVTALLVGLLLTPTGKQALSTVHFFNIQQLEVSRSDLARSNSGFGREADVTSARGIITFLPVGVVHLMFAPFPWAVRGLRQLLSLPDVLAWYALTPALLIGLRSALKKKLESVLPILVFTTAITVAYGLFLGNAGTAYRQRTQIMMFYFLFIADGMEIQRTRRRRRFEASIAIPSTPTLPAVELKV